MKDGRLLKPSSPTMSLDSTFLLRAFAKNKFTGQLSAAYTQVRVCVCVHVKCGGGG